MPFKTYASGDFLTASDLYTFMMRQQIGVFASAAARDAAITNPAEGMFAYLKDSNELYFYDGSAWRYY